MFEVTLGKYTGSNSTIELKEDAKPYPIPNIHVNILIKIGVLKKINDTQWEAPTFITPKKNKRIKRKPFPIHKHSRFITQIRRF